MHRVASPTQTVYEVATRSLMRPCLGDVTARARCFARCMSRAPISLWSNAATADSRGLTPFFDAQGHICARRVYGLRASAHVRRCSRRHQGRNGGTQDLPPTARGRKDPPERRVQVCFGFVLACVQPLTVRAYVNDRVYLFRFIILAEAVCSGCLQTGRQSCRSHLSSVLGFAHLRKPLTSSALGFITNDLLALPPFLQGRVCAVQGGPCGRVRAHQHPSLGQDGPRLRRYRRGAGRSCPRVCARACSLWLFLSFCMYPVRRA